MSVKEKKLYRAKSRVVDNNQVIGFMVQQAKGKEVYMSLDVISFGLSQKSFEIENVKLGNNGKPRGYNGFLLSKLPIVTILDEKVVNERIINTLKYIINFLCDTKEENIIVKPISISKTNLNIICSVSLKLSDYMGYSNELANQELKKTLKFYEKNLPQELKENCDSLEGNVNEKGISTIIINKSLVCNLV